MCLFLRLFLKCASIIMITEVVKVWNEMNDRLSNFVLGKIKEATEIYAGCISSALQKEDYLNVIKDAGFKNITITKERSIDIPDSVFIQWITLLVFAFGYSLPLGGILVGTGLGLDKFSRKIAKSKHVLNIISGTLLILLGYGLILGWI